MFGFELPGEQFFEYHRSGRYRRRLADAGKGLDE
jgi:hypothetical protein